MNEIADNKEIEILAKRLVWKLDLLIAQCDSWLPEEEGRRNVERRFREREKARRKERRKNLINGILRILRIDKQINQKKT